jgi:hypothetical protein
MKIERLLKYGFVIPTREYNGGVLVGFGFGMFVMTVILSPDHRAPGIFFLSLICIVIGSLLARAAQRKRFLKASNDEKPAA